MITIDEGTAQEIVDQIEKIVKDIGVLVVDILGLLGKLRKLILPSSKNVTPPNQQPPTV